MSQLLNFTAYPSWKIEDSRIIFELTNSKHAIDVEIEFNVSRNKNKKMIYKTKEFPDGFIEMGNGLIFRYDEDENLTYNLISKVSIDITQKQYVEIIKLLALKEFRGITLFFEEDTFYLPCTVMGNVMFEEKQGNIIEWKFYESEFS